MDPLVVHGKPGSAHLIDFPHVAAHRIDQRYTGSGVQLAWGVVDDELVPVGKYVGVPPRQRPFATCPVCSDRVRFNLGTRKAHHFSHAPGANCAVQSGETAAHLNTKFQIAAELRRARRLVIRESCCGSGEWRCSDSRLVTFAEGWDDVHVERGIGSLRPDILLTREDTPVAAIEVYATHAVPAEKADALELLNLPWIEVKADGALYDSEKPWTADTPLPALRREPASHWRCPMCARDLKERERRRLANEREAAYRARLRRKQAMVIDVYRPGGRHFREVIWMIAEMEEDRVISVQLWKERLRETMNKVQLRGGDLDAALQVLGSRLRRWVEYHEGKGALVDRVTGWMPARMVKDIKSLDARFPRRYRHNPSKGWHRPEPDPPRLTNLNDLLLRLKLRRE